MTTSVIKKKKRSTKYTMGADPEVFLRSKDTGSYVPSTGLFGGTKAKPVPIKDLSKGFSLQEDNVMLEFNIPPANNHVDFKNNNTTALVGVQELAYNKGLEVIISPVVVFKNSVLEDSKAMTFGCSTDKNAYQQGRVNKIFTADIFKSSDEESYRFAGGHVHLGYECPELPKFVAASFADLFLGLNFCWGLGGMDRTMDQDCQGTRRKYYGSAGRYRDTPYGIEYRSPSNFWLKSAETRAHAGYYAENLLRALSRTKFTTLKTWYLQVPWNDVRAAIDTENATAAQDIISYCSNELRMPI